MCIFVKPGVVGLFSACFYNSCISLSLSATMVLFNVYAEPLLPMQRVTSNIGCVNVLDDLCLWNRPSRTASDDKLANSPLHADDTNTYNAYMSCLDVFKLVYVFLWRLRHRNTTGNRLADTVTQCRLKGPTITHTGLYPRIYHLNCAVTTP